MNQTKLKPEQDVLIRMLNAYIHAEEYQLPPSFQAYEALFALSVSQRVAPVAWHYLSADPRALENCPADLAAFWKNYAEQGVATQTARETAFLKMYQALREGGLHPLVIKGTVCRHLYQYPLLRPSCDEDIWLPKDEFDECDILIRACGFVGLDGSDEEVKYKDSESDLHVEIHLNPFVEINAFARKENAEFQGVFDSAEELDIFGTKVLSVEPTKTLLYLYLHQLQHFHNAGAGLRLLCDIVAFAEKHADSLDKKYLRTTLQGFGLEPYIRALETIERRYLGLPVQVALFPEDGKSECDVRDLLEDMFAAGLHGNGSNTRVQSCAVTRAAVTDRAQGGGVGGRLLFPSREVMYNHYPWSKGKVWLLPAAYAVRFARFVMRTLQGWFEHGVHDYDAKWIALGKRRVKLLDKYGIMAAVSDRADETK